MTSNGIQRAEYRDGQYLGATDLGDDQVYHRDMRRRHTIAHHTWGIVYGLMVQFEKSDGLFVEPGCAIDAFGREIYHVDRSSIDPKIFDQLETESIDLWLKYSVKNIESASQDGCHASSSSRIVETARVTVVAHDPANADRRFPRHSDPAGAGFTPHLSPPDDPARTWPIFLGIVNRERTDAGELIYVTNNAGRPYAGARSEQVENPSETVSLRLGMSQQSQSEQNNGRNDAVQQDTAPRFSVHVTPRKVPRDPCPTVQPDAQLIDRSYRKLVDAIVRMLKQQHFNTSASASVIAAHARTFLQTDEGKKSVQDLKTMVAAAWRLVEQDPQLELDVSEGITIRSDTTIYGHLAVSGGKDGGVEFVAPSPTDSAVEKVMPTHITRGQVYHYFGVPSPTGSNKKVDSTGDPQAHELRVVLGSQQTDSNADENGPTSFKVGKFVNGEFKPILSVQALASSKESESQLGSVVINGDLFVEKKVLDGFDSAAELFTDAAEAQFAAAFQSGFNQNAAAAAGAGSLVDLAKTPDGRKQILEVLLTVEAPDILVEFLKSLATWLPVGRSLDQDDERAKLIVGLTTTVIGAPIPVTVRAAPLLHALLSHQDTLASNALTLWKWAGRILDNFDGVGSVVEERGQLIIGLTTDDAGTAIPVSVRAAPLLRALLSHEDSLSTGALTLWQTAGENLNALAERTPFIAGLTVDAAAITNRAEPLLLALLAFDQDPGAGTNLILWQKVGENLNELAERTPFIAGLTVDAAAITNRAEPLLLALLAFDKDPGAGTDLILWQKVGENLNELAERTPFIAGLTVDAAAITNRAEPLLLALLAYDQDPGAGTNLILWKTVGKELNDTAERTPFIAGLTDDGASFVRANALLTAFLNSTQPATSSTAAERVLANDDGKEAFVVELARLAGVGVAVGTELAKFLEPPPASNGGKLKSGLEKARDALGSDTEKTNMLTHIATLGTQMASIAESLKPVP